MNYFFMDFNNKKIKTKQISKKLLSAICVAKIYIIYGGKN